MSVFPPRHKLAGCRAAARLAEQHAKSAARLADRGRCAEAELHREAAVLLFKRAGALCRPCGEDELARRRDAILDTHGLRARLDACLRDGK